VTPISVGRLLTGLPAQPAFHSETTLVQTATKTRPSSLSAGRSGSAIWGIVFANCAVFTFTVMDAVIKEISQSFPTGEIIFFRNLFAFIPLLIFAFWRHGGLSLKTQRPWGHLMRGVFGVLSMYCFFRSYLELPLSDAIALGLSGPIFITVLSVPVLGEHVGWRRWSAVVVGFAGVVVAVFDPTGTWEGDTALGTGLVLLSAFCYALTLLTLRGLSGKEHTHNLLFYSTAFTIVVAAVPGILDWQPISWQAAGVMLVQGAASAAGQLAMIRAFRFGEASMLAPIEFTALIWATAFGFWFWGDLPTVAVLVGALLIIGANLYIAHREARIARTNSTLGKNFPPVPEHASLPE